MEINFLNLNRTLDFALFFSHSQIDLNNNQVSNSVHKKKSLVSRFLLQKAHRGPAIYLLLGLVTMEKIRVASNMWPFNNDFPSNKTVPETLLESNPLG